MVTTDFAALQQQFIGQWRAIEQAEPAERRILLAELAQVLAEWEAAQTDALEGYAALRRIGHWSALATVAAAQSRLLVEWLGEEKPALRQRLKQVSDQIETSAGEVEHLTPEVEAIRDDLSLAETQLADMEERELVLRQQLEAGQRLRELQAEVDEFRAGLNLLDETLQQGSEPTRVLGRLAGMREPLMAYYEAHLAASRMIAAQMTNGGGDANAIVSVLAAPELLAVPERLLALERELKAIDQVLANHLHQQDALDREIKARG